MPFVSQAQARWMFANDPTMAKRWAAHTPSLKKLPKRVRTTPPETEDQASKAAAIPTTDGGGVQPVLATDPSATPFEPLFVDATPAKQADAPQVDARFRGIGLVSTPSGDRMVDIAVSHARARFSEKLAEILARRSPESGPAEPSDALSGRAPVAQIIDLRLFPSICPRVDDPRSSAKSAAVQTLQRAVLNLTNPQLRTPTVASLLVEQGQGGRGQVAPLGPGKSPNANPINAFSGLSSSGALNGNAALGVKNNPGGSLKAGAQMPSAPEPPAATDWSDRLVRLAMRRHPGTKEQALAALNAELDKQAGLAATIRTTTREEHDPTCPHCNEVMYERHWVPDQEKRGMYRHRGPCYDKGPFEIHWPDQAERDAQQAKMIANLGLGGEKQAGVVSGLVNKLRPRERVMRDVPYNADLYNSLTQWEQAPGWTTTKALPLPPELQAILQKHLGWKRTTPDELDAVETIMEMEEHPDFPGGGQTRKVLDELAAYQGGQTRPTSQYMPKQALGDELAFKAWKATGLSDKEADRKAGESLEVPRGPEAEYCPHCDARQERGDDGKCNRCGKDWPEKSAGLVSGLVNKLSPRERVPMDVPYNADLYNSLTQWEQAPWPARKTPALSPELQAILQKHLGWKRTTPDALDAVEAVMLMEEHPDFPGTGPTVQHATKTARVEPLPRWKKEPQTTDWRPHAQWVGPLLASLACGLDANGHVTDLARTKTAQETEFDVTPFLLQDGDTERAYRPMYQQPAAGQPADRLYPVPRPFRSSVIDGLNMQPFDAQRTSAMTNVLTDTNRRAARIRQAVAPSRFPPVPAPMPGGGSFAPGALPKAPAVKAPAVKAPAAPKAPTSAGTKTAGSPLGAAAELRMQSGDPLGTVHNENFISSLLRRIVRRRPDSGLPSPPMPGAGKFEGVTPGPFNQPLPRPAPKPVPGMMAKAGNALRPTLTGEDPEPRVVKPYAQFGEDAAADVHARFERKELIGSRPTA